MLQPFRIRPQEQLLLQAVCRSKAVAVTYLLAGCHDWLSLVRSPGSEAAQLAVNLALVLQY